MRFYLFQIRYKISFQFGTCIYRQNLIKYSSLTMHIRTSYMYIFCGTYTVHCTVSNRCQLTFFAFETQRGRHASGDLVLWTETCSTQRAHLSLHIFRLIATHSAHTSICITSTSNPLHDKHSVTENRRGQWNSRLWASYFMGFLSHRPELVQHFAYRGRDI